MIQHKLLNQTIHALQKSLQKDLRSIQEKINKIIQALQDEYCNIDFDYYNKFINKKTKVKDDITPIFENNGVFNKLINDLIAPFQKTNFDKVVALEALGFIIGSTLAIRARKSFVPLRKKGKLPGIRGTILRTSFIDYSKNKKTLEMNEGSIKNDDKVLIVDDWIDTGAQIKAAIKLIERQKGKVIGITALCAKKNPGTKILFEKYNCRAIGVFKEQL
jgi:adenine phosphoribosyltransferase